MKKDYRLIPTALAGLIALTVIACAVCLRLSPDRLAGFTTVLGIFALAALDYRPSRKRLPSL